MLRWTSIAGAALTAGGVAWLSKIAVIVATSGRVTDTGAAGAFFLLGFVLLLIGSTGVGLSLTMNKSCAVAAARRASLPDHPDSPARGARRSARAAGGGFGAELRPRRSEHPSRRRAVARRGSDAADPLQEGAWCQARLRAGG